MTSESMPKTWSEGDGESKVAGFLLGCFAALVSAVLFLSPLARVDNDPLGYIKWFVSTVGAYWLAVLLVAHWLFRKRLVIFSSPVALPVLFMLCYSALSLSWTKPLFESTTRLWQVVVSWGLLLLCLAAPLGKRATSTVTITLIAGVTICSGIGIGQFFGLLQTTWARLPWEPELGKRVFSTMWNPNFLAGLLILTMPVILSLARRARHGWLRIALLAAYLINFVCLLMTNSWGGWAGFVASLLFLTLIHKAQAGKPTHKPRQLGTGQDQQSLARQWPKARIALLCLCAAAAIAFFGTKGERVAGTTRGFSERIKMWRSTLRLIKEHPLGLGLGNFAVFENKYEHEYIEPPVDTTKDWRKERDTLLHNSLFCHNEFLETALETGPFGLTLLLWTIAAMIGMGIRAVRQVPDEAREDQTPGAVHPGLTASVVAGGIAIIVQSLVSYPLRVPTTVTTFAVLLGLWAPRRIVVRRRLPGGRALAAAVIPLAVLGASLGSVGALRPLKAEAHYVAGMGHLLARKDYASAGRELQRAIELGLPRYEVYFRLGECQLRLGEYRAALETYKAALDIQPFHEYSYFGLGQAYEALGRTSQAIANYQKAIFYEPRLLQGYIALAALKRGAGNPQEALETLLAGLEYFPNDRMLLLDAAACAVAAGKIAKARRLLQSLLRSQPGDAAALFNLTVISEHEGRDRPASIAGRMIDSRAALWILRRSRTAALLMQRKEFLAARQELEAILKRFPDYTPALSNIGTAFFLAGNLTDAERYFLRAVRIAPKHSSYHKVLADIYIKQQRYKEAEEQLLTAKELRPDDPDVLRRLRWLEQRR